MERERTVTRGSLSARARRALARVSPAGRAAWREAWSALWTSRLVVWAAGLLGLMWFGRAPGTGQFDTRGLTTPFSALGDLLVSPAARWDSAWYLTIAQDGYGDATSHAQAAFYPLYPLLMRVGGWVVGSPLVAGILVSLACFLVALMLLHRLAALELGESYARPTVLLVAFFPSALFFSAVYSESLFLLVSVGAFLAARHERWAWAGALGGLAALTRNSGVLLLLPLAILFLYGPRPGGAPAPGRARWLPRYRLTPQVLWLALVPLGLALYLGWSAIALDDAFAPYHAQELWLRHFEPLGALTGGIDHAVDAVRELGRGGATTPYLGEGGGNSLEPVSQSLLLFGFLVFALIGLVGVLRRLPLAYGAYTAVALAMTLSYPVDQQPLISLPRYLLALFPLQLWLALWTSRRDGRLERTLGVSAVLLGLLAAQFARWGFVA
jgi:hypothetical protein